MSDGYFAMGFGVGTHNARSEWLEVFYPAPMLAPAREAVEAVAGLVGYEGGNAAIELESGRLDAIASALSDRGADEQAAVVTSLESGTRPLVLTVLADDAPPASVPEGYLKLHLLSHRLVRPHGTDLTGLFGVLPNVAWTDRGAVDVDDLPARQLEARLAGELLEVMSVDKFPKMTNYVVPPGVRVAHSARVRLGAYLGEGTTVMHEGFVNFNAGTEGPGMIEGRISAGVFVGKGSDLGGGCSTMGTLSGGNDIVISIGGECLIGANAGVGIPLGDRCTVEAGLYVTAGSVVSMVDDHGEAAGKVKARELAGQSDLLFRRNSVSGGIECLTNRSAIELNEALHANR